MDDALFITHNNLLGYKTMKTLPITPRKALKILDRMTDFQLSGEEKLTLSRAEIDEVMRSMPKVNAQVTFHISEQGDIYPEVHLKGNAAINFLLEGRENR